MKRRPCSSQSMPCGKADSPRGQHDRLKHPPRIHQVVGCRLRNRPAGVGVIHRRLGHEIRTARHVAGMEDVVVLQREIRMQVGAGEPLADRAAVHQPSCPARPAAPRACSSCIRWPSRSRRRRGDGPGTGWPRPPGRSCSSQSPRPWYRPRAPRAACSRENGPPRRRRRAQLPAAAPDPGRPRSATRRRSACRSTWPTANCRPRACRPCISACRCRWVETA